ncbi:MAG TPA: FAD-dependent oxidoreductase [Acidimicrobiia bacterium]|nr:FAD-dependent oxidoreductase [Acidimicrobiia bacterium]
MAKPVLLVVDDDATSRELVGRELATRYSADYSVLVEESAVVALQRLRELADAGVEVAVILADQWMPEMTGPEFLVAAHQIHRGARRGLLINWGEDRSAPGPIMRACALRQADYYLAKPVHAPDERFHRSMTEHLDEWWRLRGGGFEMVRVIGDERSARAHEIRDVLSRNDIPYGFYACDSPEGKRELERVGASDERRPVVISHDGHVLIDPTNREIAAAHGATVRPGTETYDVTIVGGGPSGLAAAVYAGSEGLRVAVVEHEAMGGQAGTSSMIRNYLGFPRGISGTELASRAFEQARLFGTTVVYGSAATSLRASGELRVVGLSDGSEITSRAVVIATGVSYRRLDVPELDALLGAGVYYGAGASEALALAGERVFVVGGGNSAGQAALHLAKHAEQVTILVRSGSLAASMSEYLIAEIEHASNVDVRYEVEVVGGGGESRLQFLELERRRSGEVENVDAAAVFVLIGGKPYTEWLPDAIVRDQWGYVVTGAHSGTSTDFETSLPGVFAVGDVRHGSVKRIASAVGEGSVCVSLVHDYLTQLPRPEDHPEATFRAGEVSATGDAGAHE